MPKDTLSRKAQFKAALALAGVSQKQWAEQHGVTPPHLHAVLTGRESMRLIRAIDEFITETLRRPSAAAS